MEERKDSGGKLEKFFAGKGFYIVLFLCAAVIGVSAWTLLRGSETVDEPGMPDVSLEEPAEYDDSLAGDPEYSDAMWEIPDDAQEVAVPAEPPEVAAMAPSVPEVQDSAPMAFIWPVAGQVETPHSVTALRYDKTMADWRTHDGVDITAAVGDKVMAAASGTVKEIYFDDFYGTTVVMDYGGGLLGVYSNLQEVPAVGVGDVILCGETIGSVGCTAIAESGVQPHLHYSMSLNGESVDPAEYLPAL